MRLIYLSVVISLLAILIPTTPTYAYDPFEEESAAFGQPVGDEYGDEIFFTQGRLLMLGVNVGFRAFTNSLGEIIKLGPEVGGYFDYYFSRMFAGDLSVNYSLHRHTANNLRGDLGLLDVTMRGKFFIVSDRFSDILDLLNPHISAGAGFYWRFASESAFGSSVRDVGFGFPFAVGLFIPIVREDVFLGFDAFYDLIFFGDENTVLANGDALDGDALGVVGTISFSF